MMSTTSAGQSADLSHDNLENDNEPEIQAASLEHRVSQQPTATNISQDQQLENDPIVSTRSSPDGPPQGPTPLQNEVFRPIRIPGTFPPEWLPDQEAESCMACGCLFTLIKRRHHCRSCGKIFCSDCCRHKARLLYMNNKEARVCKNCHQLIEFTLSNPTEVSSSNLERLANLQPSTSSRPGFDSSPSSSSSSPVTRMIPGVLKTHNQPSNQSNAVNPQEPTGSSSSTDQHSNKQVIFSDGIRPGTDLSEPAPCQALPSPSSSADNSSHSSFSTLSRQNRRSPDPQANCSKKSSKSGRLNGAYIKNITVCDDIGYLPPIIMSKDAPIVNASSDLNSSNPLTSLILNHFKLSRKSIQASMESRNCPLNGVVKFSEISDLVGIDNVITFLLLRGFHLKVKIVKKDCCLDRKRGILPMSNSDLENEYTESENHSDFGDRSLSSEIQALESSPDYWCFASSGLDKFGQDEIVLLLDKDKDDPCIPRDIFKIYLTLHELALRRQAIENLGNLLFQDGLFNCRDTAGLLFVRPSPDHCLKNLILPEKKFLIALLLQRWEVPWSKVFPMRLLLRLGYKYEAYPFPIVSFKQRDPVYYEIGHTIISILGDFRNFRYSLTHVDGLKVMLDKTSRKVTIELQQSNYVQFNKVLDSSNNEHVLAWSSCPSPEADGHLVSVQNDEGNYNTVEFYKQPSNQTVSFKNLETGLIIGASFVVFSGALKVNQSGQPAKISIVEDGLLIQIQSCTMSALRNAIHYMDNFDIDCENNQDLLNRVEIRWLLVNARSC